MTNVIHINSKDYDKKIDIDNGSRLTYYFKDPIILNEETNLKINSFINNKKQNSSAIEYPESLNSLASFNNFNTNTNQLGAISYNQAVIDEETSNVTVYLFSTQAQAFYATDARITVKTVKNANDDNGLIEFIRTDQRGSDFSINQIFYIRKADITAPTTLYNSDNSQTYAIFGVQTLNGGTEIKTVSTYSGGAGNIILSYATGTPVTAGTFYNIPLYKPDGSGWYDFADVRCTASVFSTTGTNYGTVVVDAITVGGSGFNLNDLLYLDKFSVVDGVYPNTYASNARFATVQVSALVNGIATAYPSNGIDNVILPNSREYTFVDEILYNVPFYEIKNAQYTATTASGTVNIVKNAGNNQGTATLVAITDGGSGFAVPVPLYLDKEDLIINNNTYFSNRYIGFDGVSLVDDSADRDIVILSGNYGFETYGILEVDLGFYYYSVPNKNTNIFIEITNPSNSTANARITSITGGEGFAVGDTIEFLRSDVVNVQTGAVGWNKTLSSGNLILQVVSVSATNFTTYNVNFYIENILYNNSKYFNSSSFTKCKIFQIDLFRKYLQNDNVILSLIPQIIQSIEIFVDRTLDELEDFQFCLNLEKNNMYLQ
jgi:hypothetical protein